MTLDEIDEERKKVGNEIVKELFTRFYSVHNGKVGIDAAKSVYRHNLASEKEQDSRGESNADTKFGGKEFIVNALRKADEKMGETRSIWYLNKEDRKALNKNMRDDYDRLEDIYYSKKEKDPKFEKYVKETYGVESSDKLKGENLDYAIEDYSYNTNYDKLRSKVDKD